MDWVQVVVLALIQGVTEFLPISSSAHLVIPSLLLHWPDQGLHFDVAVHVGTLSAVLYYFRADLRFMLLGLARAAAGGGGGEGTRLVWLLVLGTLPAGLSGVLGNDFVEQQLRSLPVIALATLVFGLLLGVADRRGAAPGQGAALDARVVLLIGLAQALALVPGVSRSGITLTAGLLLGLDRQAAARFSFLLSIPIIASAGALYVVELASGGAQVNWAAMAIGAALSGVAAYICIGVFLRLLDRVGLMPFVYYRVALGLLLLLIWGARMP